MYLSTVNPGQDREGRMNWDQIIPLTILLIIQVGCSHGHLTREPGS